MNNRERTCSPLSPSQIKRHPRKWIVLWTYGRSVREIADDILNRMDKEFPQLLELVPKDDGYIHLKVKDLDFKFVEILSAITGVGGILSKDYVERIKAAPVEKSTTTPKAGELVTVQSGTLKGAVGRVLHSRSSVVTVSVPILGSLHNVMFLEDELIS